MKTVIFLTIDEVLALHKRVIEQFGGCHGIRDKGLLESALAQPEIASIYQKDDIHLMAAGYIFHLIKNHPFIDGNKRTGSIAALWFLQNNGYHITLSDAQLYRLAISTATSKLSKPNIATFLKRHSKKS